MPIGGTLKNGGKASIVAPLTALYPLVVIVLAPVVQHESITRLQVGGMACTLVAIVRFSA